MVTSGESDKGYMGSSSSYFINFFLNLKLFQNEKLKKLTTICRNVIFLLVIECYKYYIKSFKRKILFNTIFWKVALSMSFVFYPHILFVLICFSNFLTGLVKLILRQYIALQQVIHL